MPEELAVRLAPDTESEEGEGTAAAHTGGANTAADCLSSGKRHAEGEAGDDGASHSQSGCGAGACAGTASCGSARGGEEQHSTGSYHAGKRLRADASSSANTAELMAAAALEPLTAAELVGNSHGPGADSPPLCSRMVPVALPPSAAAATPAQLAPPVPALGSAASRNRGRPAGAPRLRPLPPPPPVLAAPPVVAVAHPPSKPVTRQKNQAHHHTSSAPGERKGVFVYGLACRAHRSGVPAEGPRPLPAASSTGSLPASP